MTAPRPTRLDVLGHAIGVSWVAYEARLYQGGSSAADEDRKLSGVAQLDVDRIAIRDRDAVAAERQTLVHEVVHAILWLTGHDAEDEKDEPMVQALSTGFLHTLRANPELVAYLLAE